MDKAFVLLPQTLVKMWGINFKPDTKFYQFAYPIRFKNDGQIINAIYSLNELILKEINFNFESIIEIDEKYEFDKSKIIIDSQILTLKKYYPVLKDLKNFEIVNYTMNGHPTVSLSEIFPINHFIRSLVRNLRMSKSYKPKAVWNLNYDWHDQSHPIFELFWKNKTLDLDKIKSISKSFMKNNSTKFPEFESIKVESKVLLVLPPNDISLVEFLENFENKLDQSKKFREEFESCDFVLVKQHRVSLNDFPVSFTISSKKVLSLNSALSKILPAEVILFAFPNIALFSAPSSAMFARMDIDVFTFNSFNSNERKEYGFIYHRAFRNGMRFL
jgi:hypothetical protein